MTIRFLYFRETTRRRCAVALPTALPTPRCHYPAAAKLLPPPPLRRATAKLPPLPPLPPPSSHRCWATVAATTLLPSCCLCHHHHATAAALPLPLPCCRQALPPLPPPRLAPTAVLPPPIHSCKVSATYGQGPISPLFIS